MHVSLRYEVDAFDNLFCLCYLLVTTQITDPDNAGGPFQTHICVINNQLGDGSFFTITLGTMLTVKGQKRLNMHEHKKHFSVSVTCLDNGHPQLNVRGNFTIAVTGTSNNLICT